MKKTLVAVITLVIGILVYQFFYKKENSQNYDDHISMYRHERAEYFRYSPESPFLKQKVNFTYLNYYPANTDFRINAIFDKNDNLDTVALATSTGTIDKFILIGMANFEFKKIDNSLLVLRSTNQNDKTLFIPFMDKTNGESTYGAGRYLDVNLTKGNSILLDFNKSYNPYCAYTEAYTCPFPPKENRLNIAIEAGEKSYPEH
jgi:uncharacterized protein